jgi:hypothetical protein
MKSSLQQMPLTPVTTQYIQTQQHHGLLPPLYEPRGRPLSLQHSAKLLSSVQKVWNTAPVVEQFLPRKSPITSFVLHQRQARVSTSCDFVSFTHIGSPS